jgi:putative transposase
MAGFVTREAARARFRELSDQVDAAYAEMRELSTDEVGNEFRVEMAERLETQERTVEVIAGKGAWLIEWETTPDHVHLLGEVDPQFGIHRLVEAIKGRSSRVLREEFPRLKSKLPSLWTNSYFVAMVGGAPLSVIKRYVETRETAESC